MFFMKPRVTIFIIISYHIILMIRNPEEYYPRKLGVRYNPPAIIIEYGLLNQQKTMYHKILIPTLEIESQILASAIKKQNLVYFYKDRITEGNIRKLIEKLKRGASGNSQGSKLKFKNNEQKENKNNQELRNNQNIRGNQKQKIQPIPYSKAESEKDMSQINEYYEQQFDQFQGSQQSKSKIEQSQHLIKKSETPFQFLTQEPEPPKFSKSQMSSKPKVIEAKKLQKEVPKPQPEAVQEDCFQYL